MNGSVLSEKLIVGNFLSLPKEYKSMTRLWKWMESAWWVSHRILLQQSSETPIYNAAVDMCAQVCGRMFFLLGTYLRMESLGHVGNVCVTR